MRWLLPEYVEDILPAEAMRMERLRRRVLDLFFKRGYELVMPPLLEYMDSLLTGTGHDLELRTFKVVDQFSGRMMGVRADITPQVARIDAHLLNRKSVTRLCYCGSVLHTRPAAPGATREPIQLGAEIYGAAGVEALDTARKRLPKLPALSQALKTLRALAKACPVPVSFDLAELRGYHYHSGVVFDAYCAGGSGPASASILIARGGRYDEVGKAFGRARPATGLSIDLRSVAGVVK